MSEPAKTQVCLQTPDGTVLLWLWHWILVRRRGSYAALEDPPKASRSSVIWGDGKKINTTVCSQTRIIRIRSDGTGQRNQVGIVEITGPEIMDNSGKNPLEAATQ